jgi:hypothetical protein
VMCGGVTKWFNYRALLNYKNISVLLQNVGSLTIGKKYPPPLLWQKHVKIVSPNHVKIVSPNGRTYVMSASLHRGICPRNNGPGKHHANIKRSRGLPLIVVLAY